MRTPPRRHSLEDHRLGQSLDHRHLGDEDHDHDDPGHELLGPQSRALELTPFVSIGVDVGTACVQIVFSRLAMRGPGEPASLRRLVRSRETLWVSRPAFTPWREGAVDAGALRALVDAAFEEAGVHPDDVETGVVILTGEASKSGGAGAVLSVLSEEIGELVCAAAGDRMEAMLAAWGSGAVRRSLEEHARILLVDIGGGTTKFAIAEEGRVRDVAALRAGGRLAVFDDDGRLSALTPEGAQYARRVGLAWRVGSLASEEEIARVGAALAQCVLQALMDPHSRELEGLWLTEPFAMPARLDGVLFSGGVAEYVDGGETRWFGDLGKAFGVSLRERIAAGAWPWPVLPAGERIRATALGAAEHSLQLSGETCFVSSPGRLLPRRNMQVLAPPFSFAGPIEPQALASAIRAHRRLFDSPGRENVAFAFRWRGEPDHARLAAFARGLAAGLGDLIAADRPLFILLEGDAALTLAGILRVELGIVNDMLVLDGLVLRDFDYVDIGRLRLPSNTVPVTVKSLQLGLERKRT